MYLFNIVMNVSDNQIKYINSVLCSFFPYDLNVIILEYTILKHQTDNETIIINKNPDADIMATISSGKGWIFCEDDKTLKSVDILDMPNYTDDNNIFICKTPIFEVFVYYGRNIYIFDEKCKQKKIINMQSYLYVTSIAVYDSKIFINYEFTIYIYDMNGTLLQLFSLEYPIRNIKIINDNLYIQHINSILRIPLQKWKNREIKLKFPLKDFYVIDDSYAIEDFYVIDDYIYVVRSAKSSIAVYDYFGNKIDRMYSARPTYIYFDNGIIYIFSRHCTPKIITKKLNIREILKKID